MRRKWPLAVIAIVLTMACVMLVRSPDLPKNLRFLEGSKQTPTLSNSKRIHEVPLSDSLTIEEVRDELEQAGGHRGTAAGLEVWNYGDFNVFLVPGRSFMTKIPGGRSQAFQEPGKYLTVIIQEPVDQNLWDRISAYFIRPSKK